MSLHHGLGGLLLAYAVYVRPSVPTFVGTVPVLNISRNANKAFT